MSGHRNTLVQKLIWIPCIRWTQGVERVCKILSLVSVGYYARYLCFIAVELPSLTANAEIHNVAENSFWSMADWTHIFKVQNFRRMRQMWLVLQLPSQFLRVWLVHKVSPAKTAPLQPKTATGRNS